MYATAPPPNSIQKLALQLPLKNEIKYVIFSSASLTWQSIQLLTTRFIKRVLFVYGYELLASMAFDIYIYIFMVAGLDL